MLPRFVYPLCLLSLAATFTSLHDIHVPRVPHPRFRGATPMGPRGDTIAQTDWCTGESLSMLERLGLADDTIVIFTSDNGPVVDDGYRDQAVEKLGDHRPAGPLRGGKYSNFEGGTRVPLIVRWPARVAKSVTSEALVGQIDLFRSLATLTDQDLPAAAAPDSLDILPALLGETAHGRSHLVEQARAPSLRSGYWKYIEPGRGPAVNEQTNTELGNSPQPALYDLSSDVAERNIVAEDFPAKLAEMRVLLANIKSGGVDE